VIPRMDIAVVSSGEITVAAGQVRQFPVVAAGDRTPLWNEWLGKLLILVISEKHVLPDPDGGVAEGVIDRISMM